MKAFLSLLLVGVTLSNALPRQKRSTPCAYFKGGSDREPLLDDEYTVELNPGYTLEEHYEFIGFDLSAKAEMFDPRPSFGMYDVKIDGYTMHKIIRHDPGVLRVTHNMVLSPEKPWYKKHPPVNESYAEDRLQKRWSRWGGVFHYSTGHINEWQKASKYMDEFYHTDIINTAGKGVDVYIFDGGLEPTHDIWRRFGNFRFLRNDKHYTDEKLWEDAEHGTGVGGVVSRNAPYATIVGVKVLGDGGTYARMTGALRDILEDHNKYKTEKPDEYKGAVINMSMGLFEEYPPLQSEIQSLIAAGVPVVTSAGNSGHPNGTRPCGYDDVICVGAIAKDYSKTSFSNYDKWVTLYSPGHNIHVPDPSRHDAYHYMTGTSFAAPMVSAILATYIGYEGINNNASKAIERMKQNWHEDVLSYATPNILVNSGINHPDKKTGCPYKGIEVCDAEEQAQEIDTGLSVDTPVEPAKFLDEPNAGPIETPPCPTGCSCEVPGVPLCY